MKRQVVALALWLTVTVDETWGGVQYTVANLGTLGGSESVAYGINDSRHVVGSSYVAEGSARHAFLYSNGRMSDLGASGGLAYGINDSGQVVGYADTSGDAALHAFRTAANQPINPTTDDLGTLGRGEANSVV